MLDAGSKIVIVIVILIVIFQFLIPGIEMADRNVRPPFSSLCTLLPPSSGFFANGVKLQSPPGFHK